MRLTNGASVLNLVLALLASLVGRQALAQPTGGQVVAGTATLSAGAGGLTVTQTSARAIINWQDFSLAAGSFARFVQPDATSATLNRVISGLPSNLFGTLEANGNIFLINPNGVVIGAMARIDAGGFLASTLDVTNQDFLAGGDLHFSGGSAAAVQNLGAINALGGDVFLIARRVENSGTVTAAKGTAGLAAGSEILLTTGGNERLFVHAASAPGAVVNAGAITAATAELKAAGGNAYALAINNSGLVRATGFGERDGAIWLLAQGGNTASSGTLAASSAGGAQGGDIHLLGDKVTLAAGALVDVSGAQGGGTALIGGDYQGGNPAVLNARTTVVEPGATIRADATVAGNAGRVIVWADDSTVFGGAIAARGAAGGDGGFAEVSGKNFLSFRGTVDLAAPAGRVGSLLLDPANLTLQSATPDLNGDSTTGDDVSGSIAAGSFAGLNSIITSGQVATLLGTTNLSLAATSAINVNAAVSWNSAFGLTLDSGGAIAVNAAITNAGTGGLTLNAGSTVSLVGSLSTAGTVTLNHAGALTRTFGTVTAATVNFNGVGAVATTFSSLPLTAATVVLNKGSGAGGIFVRDTVSMAISGTTTGGLSLLSTGDITVNQNLTTAGTTTLQAASNGGSVGTVTVASGKTLATTNSPLNISGVDVDLQGSLNSGTAQLDISPSGNQGIGLGAVPVAGGLNLDGGEIQRITATGFSMNTNGNIVVGGITAANSNNIAGLVDLNAHGSGSTFVFGPAATTFHTLSANSTTSIAVNGLLTIDVGNLTLTAASDITQTQPIEMTGPGAAWLTGNNITLMNADNTLGDLSVSYRSGNVAIHEDSLISITSIGHNGGNLVLDSATDIAQSTVTGGIEIDGGSVLMKAAGNVTLNGNSTVTATGTGPDPLVIVAGGNFINNLGAGALVAPNGRWLVYSTSPAGSFENGLTSATGSTQPRFYQKTYAANAPATIAAGNHLIYSTGTLTVTASDSSRTYGSANPAFSATVTGLISDDGVTDTISSAGLAGLPVVSSLAGATSPVSGNPYAITPTLGSLATNLGYAFSFVPGNLTINRADLTLTGTQVYSGLTAFAGSNLLATGVNGETFPITGAGAAGNLASKDVQTGTSLATTTGLALGVSLNGGVANNYNPLFQATSSVSVTKANLTLSGTRVYNGTTVFAAADLGSAATGVNGETFALSGAGDATNLGSKNVQSGPLASVTGLTLGAGNTGAAVASNYNALAAVHSTISVTKANLTLTGTRVYDGTTAFAATDLGSTATGVAGETFALTGSGVLSTKNVQTAQPLGGVTGLTLGAGNTGAAIATNYNSLAPANASVSVTKAPLTITTSDVVKTYDGTTTANGTPVFLAGHLFSGDTLTFGSLGPTYAFVGADVGLGNKTVTVSGINVNDGNSGQNYNRILVNNTSSTINPFAVNLTGTRVYNGTTAVAAGIFTFGSLANSETLTLTGAGTVATKDVGTNKTVTVTGLTLGDGTGLASNYTFVGGTQTASITKADLTLSGTRVYNGTSVFAGGLLTATGVNGETFALNGAGDATNLGSKDVQAGPLASVTGLTLGTGNTGAAVSTNYNALNVTASSVSVTPADLTLSGARVYDGSTIFAGANLTATGVNGETFTVTGAGAVGNLLTKNVQTNQLLNTVTGLTLGSGNTGAAVATNYHNLSVANSTVSVTPKPLTIAGFASNDKIYDGTTAAVVATPGTLSGVVLGDTVGFSNTGATFDTKNVGTGKTVTLNGVTLTGSGDQFNYTYTATTTDVSDITAATLTYVANSANRLYGSANPAFNGTVTGFVNGETLGTATTGVLVFTSAAIATNNVGSYAIPGSGLTANNGNYVFVQAPGNATALTINPAPLTITADNKSRAVGVANPPLTASYAGFVNGETLAVVSGLSLATTAVIGSTAGSYPITPSGATAPNYTLAFVDGTLAVGGNLLTITADNKTKIYGAALPAFTASYSGFVNGDSPGVVTGLQFSTTATIGSNVGTFAITPFGASASSYALAYVPGTLTINPAALTITANNASRIYGAGNPAFGASFAGLVNGDASSVVTGLTFGTTASAASNVGNYPITPSNGVAANYTITNVPGTLAVNPAALTITADNKSKIYGAALPTFTATYTGLVNGDASSVVTGLTLTSTATAASNVGTSAITPANGTAANYTITNTPGTLTTTPAALTITADNKSKVYGAALPGFTATYSGLVNGDASSVVTGLTLTSPSTAASNVGTSAITPANGAAANYTISNAPGTLTITPAPLTITADSKSRAAGVANPTLTATYFGLVNNDTTAVVGGLSLATTALIGSPVGSYPITASGATAANYNVAFVDGVLAVGQNLLTITADNKSKAYGAALPTFTASYNGFVNGDTSSVVTGLQFNTTATIGSNVGTFAITPFGATASSYVLAYVAGTLTINPAILTYTATPTSRFFNTGNPAFGGTITGFISGESQSNATTGTMVFASPATTSSPVGVYAINGSGLVANNGNYSFVQAASNATAFTINPQVTPPPPPPPTVTPLTITADNKSKTYGAPLPTFTASYAGFINGDTSSLVTGLQFSTTATISSNVGTFAITPFGATAPSFYTVGYVPGVLTINPAVLTYTATPTSRFVGVANPIFGGTVTGFVNGDTLSTATTGTTSFNTTATIASPVGIYPINGSGLTANNGNYSFVQAPPNATALTLGALTPVPLTITADDKRKTYGAALPTFTATYAGFVNGDSASNVTGLQFSTTATIGSNVGTFAITPFGATAPSIYTVGYVPGTLTINPAALTLTADNKSRTYGAANPAFTDSITGFVNGDTASILSGVQFNTTATVASNVGSYAITPSGGSAANYTLAYVPGTLAVSPAPLTVTATNASRLYGTANPTFTATFAGFVNGNTSAIVTGLQLTTPAASNFSVGNYAITASGASAPNYALTFVPGTLTITPASLTLTAANATRPVGTANPAFTGSFSGFVNGDTAAVVSGLAFSTPATAASAVGAYPITPSATAVNYTLTFVNGTLSLTAPTVTVDTTPAPVVTINQQPVISPGFAVIQVGDRRVLVPVDSTGGVVTVDGGSSVSVDGRLAITLGEVTGLPNFESRLDAPGSPSFVSLSRAGGPNFGGFDLVTSLPGIVARGGADGFSGAQANDPGLFRESTVNMGGFNVIYHEAITEARQQAAGNTALGSSYREFSDSDNPQLNLVRAKPERKPAEPAAGRNSTGS